MRFLFVDRIVELNPGESIRGVKHVTRDDDYLCPDDEGRLCFVPSLMGETLGQLAAWNVMQHCDFTHRPVAGVVASARLHRPAYVGETVLLESFIDTIDATVVHYHSVARVGDEVVFSIDGALGPLLPMTDFIDADLVRRQFIEINRPGDWGAVSAASMSSLGKTALLSSETGALVPSMRFDRILASEPGVQLSAEKCITRAAAYFADHFPHKPVLPLTVLLECKLNLAREFVQQAGLASQYRIHELRKIKMSDFVYPGDRVVTTVTVKRHDDEELVLSYRTTVENKRVCVLEVVMRTINNDK